LDTANLSKVFDNNDFPKPEDFIIAGAGGLEKADIIQEHKENLEEGVS
jgi:hypothetical protein